MEKHAISTKTSNREVNVKKYQSTYTSLEFLASKIAFKKDVNFP